VTYSSIALFTIAFTVGIPGLTRKEVAFLATGLFMISLDHYLRRWWSKRGIAPIYRRLDFAGILLIAATAWEIVARL